MVEVRRGEIVGCQKETAEPSRFFFSNPPSRSEGKETHLFCCRKYGRAESVISVKIRKSNGGMMRGMRQEEKGESDGNLGSIRQGYENT